MRSATTGFPPGFAADFGTTSIHLEPLMAPVRSESLPIEPASAAASEAIDSIVPLVAASAGRIPAARELEGDSSEAGFLIELMEAAAAEPTIGRALGTICERLAKRLGARRGAAFLRENGHVVPRAARYADGSRDPEAWERFRSATSIPELVETVLRTGETAIAEEPDSPLIAGWWAEKFDLGAALAVPIGRPPDADRRADARLSRRRGSSRRTRSSSPSPPACASAPSSSGPARSRSAPHT